MKAHHFLRVSLGIAAALGLSTLAWASTFSETEPNNTPGTANPLGPKDTVTGAISPVGDVDYFSVAGLNTTWGFIALLDTSASSPGTLTALRSDGTTVLQTDTGSWVKGSGIALQSFVDGSATHYLKVNEPGDDATIASYSLRYYNTVVTPQPEVEPNDTHATATPSSFTMNGVLSSLSDVDCFAFHGRLGDTILLALDATGSTIDPILTLRDPSDAPLATAKDTGVGGKEFIEYVGLPSEGVYTYCVSAASGVGGAGATYRVGLVRNGNLYFPSYSFNVIWTNPRPGNYALVGDLLTFDLSVSNTSPVEIPGNIRLRGYYTNACLEYVSSNPVASSVTSNYISWDGQKPGGLGVGETYLVSMTMRARQGCAAQIREDLGLAYFFTGASTSVDYKIWWNSYLPLLLTNFP